MGEVTTHVGDFDPERINTNKIVLTDVVLEPFARN